MNSSHEQLLDAYRLMKSIREFEERMRRENQAGTVPGFVRLPSPEKIKGAIQAAVNG
jgi:pyruvate dehydrogenase E1 component alpha subunit